MRIKGLLRDLSGASRITKAREEALNSASSDLSSSDSILETAIALHPGRIDAEIIAVEEASISSKKITFHSDKMPLFKAGTYMVVTLKIGDSLASRPYSIVSSPLEAKRGNASIIVRDVEGGFFSAYLCHDAKIGDKAVIEVGLGQFYIEPERDGSHIVGLAGGAGITPFLAMAKEIDEKGLNRTLTIIHGSNKADDIVGAKDLAKITSPNVKVVDVIAFDSAWNGEKGFVDKSIIEKYTNPKEDAYFICGPKAMGEEMRQALAELGVKERRIREESYSAFNPSEHEEFPQKNIGKTFQMIVEQGKKRHFIPARGDESIAVALEKAGLFIHTCCRSGFCGVCRVKILDGACYIPKEMDHRRAADKKFGYVHACSAYPLGDVIIRINID